MKVTLGLAAALVFAGSAVASSANPSWTLRDMKAAVRAVGYPKPHPVKLGCKGLGATTSAGYTSFRCTARYGHHVRRRFFVEGKGQGGWLCAGKTLAGCNVLRHGFVPTAKLASGGLQGAAELAAVGYMQNRYGIGTPYRTGLCTQTGSASWTCGYKTGDTTSVDVTISLKAARGGYTFTATSTPS